MGIIGRRVCVAARQKRVLILGYYPLRLRQGAERLRVFRCFLLRQPPPTDPTGPRGAAPHTCTNNLLEALLHGDAQQGVQVVAQLEILLICVKLKLK